MLNQETIKKMAGYLKIKESDLETAIKDTNEVALEVGEFTVLTAEELAARDTNKIDEGKKLGVKDGEATALNIWKTELGKKLNVELKGERIGDVAQELKGLINATSDDKLKTLQEQAEALLKDKTTLEGKVATLEQEKGAIAFESTLLSQFPANRAEGLKDSERLMLMKQDLTFETVDGKTIVKRNGEIVKDAATHAPLPVDKVIAEYFAERKWIAEQQGGDRGGRGGGNSGGGTPSGVKNKTQAIEAWKAKDPANNVNPMSPEFMGFLTEVAKGDPQFDMYS